MHSPEERGVSPYTAYHYNLNDLRSVLPEVLGEGIRCHKPDAQSTERISQTELALSSHHKVLYNPMIEVDGLRASADAIVCSDGQWRLILVRAAKGVKNRTLLTAAFIYEVFQRRFPQLTIELAHLNKSRQSSDQQSPIDFLEFTNLTAKAKKLSREVREVIADIHTIQLANDTPIVPIGPQCKSPYPCPFMEHCWGRSQDERSILQLVGNKGLEWKLLNDGYQEMTEVPSRLLQSQEQITQVNAWRSREMIAMPNKLSKWYQQVKWPVAFLDFETFGPVFPLKHGMAPLQQLPFQFSACKQETPNKQFELFHFLAKARDGYLHALAEELSKALQGVETVIVYGAPNERMILRLLATLLPVFKEIMDEAAGKLVDIQEPFQRQWLYKDYMNGTSSLKKVVRAFSPENDYDQLQISNGYEAATTFEAFTRTENSILKNEMSEQLMRYCHKDTYVMTRLLEVIRDESAQQSQL